MNGSNQYLSVKPSLFILGKWQVRNILNILNLCINEILELFRNRQERFASLTHTVKFFDSHSLDYTTNWKIEILLEKEKWIYRNSSIGCARTSARRGFLGRKSCENQGLSHSFFRINKESSITLLIPILCTTLIVIIAIETVEILYGKNLWS